MQFILATHAEELVRGVHASRIISVLSQKPSRLTSKTGILTAMADVSNAELAQLAASPMVLYVEGETDERILRGWARACGAEEALNKVCFHHLGGGSKSQMKDATDRHFEGIRQILPKAKRLVLFDFDTSDNAYHPEPANPILFEWKRRNIENYTRISMTSLTGCQRQSPVLTRENFDARTDRSRRGRRAMPSSTRRTGSGR